MLYVPSARLHQFLVLRQVELGNRLTQKMLADRCDLSVAMINAIIKLSETAGLLHCQRQSRRIVIYRLTPSGKEFLRQIQKELHTEKRRLRNEIDKLTAPL